MSELGKQLNKQLKSKQLSKLKFYCQVCSKQCRDENGYKQHLKSPHHLKLKSQITSKDIENFNKVFEKGFLKFLKISHGEKWVNANKVYNAYIIFDKDHVHMNSTKYTSLTKFIQHLGKNNMVKVRMDTDVDDNNDNNNNNSESDFPSTELSEEMVNSNSLMISYIDNSSETVLRREHLKQLEKNTLSENQTQLLILERQMLNAEKYLQDEQPEQPQQQKKEEENEEEGHVNDEISAEQAKPLKAISLITKTTNKITKKPKRKKNIFE